MLADVARAPVSRAVRFAEAPTPVWRPQTVDARCQDCCVELSSFAPMGHKAAIRSWRTDT